MAVIRFIPDPFKPHRWVERDCANGIPAIDAVRATFPEHLDAAVIILRNARRLHGDEVLEAGDSIVVGIAPEGAAFGAAVLKAVISALISAAVSYLVSALTKPKPRNSNAKSASPSYSIQLDQNAARLSDIVPVIYGRVRAMPDIASQPYSEFNNHNERAYMILCLGMGEFTINDVYVGESRVRDLPEGNVRYWQIGPYQHNQILGNVEWLTGVNEDMATIAESTGIDISAPNDPSEASVIATVSGGTLTPVDPNAWNVWAGLVPGKLYNVANSTGGGITAAFVGIGPNNSAVWDRALPVPTGSDHFDGSMILQAYSDPQRGPMAYMQFSNTHTFKVGELILIENQGSTLGPFEIFEKRPNSLVWNMFISGTGWVANFGPNGGIWPSQAARVITSGVVNWTVSEYQPGTNPAEPFRWLGWFMTGRSSTTTNRIYVDVVMPNGIAWITDKGNYVNFNVTFAIEIQQVNSDGVPEGGVWRFNQNISGATMNARKVTWAFDMPTARYRIRVARATKRDDAASKEVSNATLFAVRFRVYHPPGTGAYEHCTLLVMQFTAGSGLAAAASRRVTVDCTRLIQAPLYSDTLLDTSNPADIVRDAYTDLKYGGARPYSELDIEKFAQLRPQWATTPGFNAIYDSQITLIEAMQQMLNVVRAIPTPTGKLMSVTQDAPRPEQFGFDDSNIVVDSTTIGYGFDGEDIPDCLEIVYTNPTTFTEARVYYPSQGARPESLELFGCTNADQAYGWAKCVWQDRKLNHKTCEFELEAEGYLLGPLTRYGVSIPSLSNQQSGRVVAVDAQGRVKLDAKLGPLVGVMAFVGDDGKQGPWIGIDWIDPTRTIVSFASVPQTPIYPADNRRDATVWRAAVYTEQAFHFQCVNIQTGGAMRVRVNGKQYSDAAYYGTFVENWITGD